MVLQQSSSSAPLHAETDRSSSSCNSLMKIVSLPLQNETSFGWGDFPSVSTSTTDHSSYYHSYAFHNSYYPTSSSSVPMMVESGSEDESYISSEEEETDNDMMMDCTSPSERSSQQHLPQHPARSVQFGDVHVQEYAVICDHSHGEYSLTLDWSHSLTTTYTLDEYESQFQKFDHLVRLSPADRRLRVAAVNGQSIAQLYQEEQQRQRRQQEQEEESQRADASQRLCTQLQQSLAVSA